MVVEIRYNEDDVWQKIIKHKYLKSNSILDVSHKQSDSAIWADLLKVKDIYLQGRKKVVRDGKTTFFWKDTWLYEKPLCILYPVLFKFCQQQNILVTDRLTYDILMHYSNSS